MSLGEANNAVAPVGNASVSADGTAAPRSLLRRLLLWIGGGLLLCGLTIGLIVVGLLYFNIESTPFVGRLVRDQLTAVLQDRIDPGMRLSIDNVDIQRVNDETRIIVSDFIVRDASGRSLVHAPSGSVAISTASLLGLKVVPTSVSLTGVKANVIFQEDGGVAIVDEERKVPGSAVEQTASTAPLDKPVSIQKQIGDLIAGISSFRQSFGGRLPDITIENSSISLRDAGTGRTREITGVGGRLMTDAGGRVTARVLLGKSPVIATDIELSAPGEQQTFTARMNDLPLRSVMESSGKPAAWLDKDARLRLTAKASVGADGEPRTVSVQIEGGKALLDLDRKMAPIPVDSAVISLVWNTGKDAAAVTFEGKSDGSLIRLKGGLTSPTAGDTGWQIALSDAGSELAPLAAGEKPITFDRFEAALKAFPERGEMAISSVQARIGQSSADMSGMLTFVDGRPGLALDVKVAATDGRTALRLWPGFAATDVRNWAVKQVRSGRLDKLALKLDMPPDVLSAAMNDKPLPAAAVALSFSASDAALIPGPGLPLVRNLSGSGQSTGQSVAFDIAPGAYIEAEQGRRITLGDGTFTVADVSRKPADGRLKVNLSGPIEAALDVIKAPGIQAHLPKGLETTKARGQIEGELSVALKLAPQINPADTRVAFAAKLKNLAIDKAIAAEKIEGGMFVLNADKDAFSLKGDAMLFGTRAGIEVKGAGKAPAMANVTLTMDEAARARKGINLGSAVTGPAIVKVAARLDGENEDVTLEADLTRMAINPVVPGLAKRAGVPGRLRGVARETENGNWLLEKMEFDAGGISARGSIQLGKDGAFNKAQLSSLKFAPGDTMQLDAERAGSTLKISARANSMDVRPFLKSVLTGGIEKSGGRDVELNLKSTVLAGFNGELVANADVKMLMRGGGLHGFSLTGRFDGGAITARLQPGGGAQGTLIVASDDGGAFLRFFDIYNRMRGGRLDLSARLGNGSQQGSLTVRNFTLRDEPAMRRLVATPETQGQGGDNAQLSQAPQRLVRNAQDVPFTRMSVLFARTPGRLDLKDGTLIGPEIGGNIEGRLDYAHDTANLSGTFVPAYSLNNALANVPLVGPIITGGRHEGLFAVRYHITGKASAPTLQVNPLSAIAPGFLRRLIDFRGSGEAAP